MPAVFTNVRLYGPMGVRFGRVHRLALDTHAPAEAVQALTARLKGFHEYLMRAKDQGIGFAVFAGTRNLSEDQLDHPTGEDDIRIAPILMGSKNGGIFSVILGAALIAVAVFATGGLAAAFAAGAGGWGTVATAGAAMAISGAVSLLTPMPHGLASKDKGANTPSYSFNGPLNTEAQGHPVPLLYGGPLKVGSAVISAGIDTRESSAAYQPPKAGESHMGYGGSLNVGRSELQ